MSNDKLFVGMTRKQDANADWKPILLADGEQGMSTRNKSKALRKVVKYRKESLLG